MAAEAEEEVEAAEIAAWAEQTAWVGEMDEEDDGGDEGGGCGGSIGGYQVSITFLLLFSTQYFYIFSSLLYALLTLFSPPPALPLFQQFLLATAMPAPPGSCIHQAVGPEPVNIYYC